jgi:hypothetical protein
MNEQELNERRERLRIETLALRNPLPEAMGSRIMAAFSSYGYCELRPTGNSSTPPEGVMCRGAASVLRAVAVALSNKYAENEGSYGGPMPSEVEFTPDDAVSALGLLAQYLDHGAELVAEVRLARLDEGEAK